MFFFFKITEKTNTITAEYATTYTQVPIRSAPPTYRPKRWYIELLPSLSDDRPTSDGKSSSGRSLHFGVHV